VRGLAGCLAAPMRLLDRDSGEELATYSGQVNTNTKLECAFTNTDAYVVRRHQGLSSERMLGPKLS
jgi:hypothetical protein